jgi:predicted nucleotidyltransferase
MSKAATKDEVLRILKEQLPYLRESFGIDEIAVYGSFSKGTQTRKSDVDLIVRLTKPLGLEFVSLADHLESVLGRKVDIATFETLRRSKENPRRKRLADEIERTLSYV